MCCAVEGGVAGRLRRAISEAADAVDQRTDHAFEVVVQQMWLLLVLLELPSVAPLA